MVSRDFHPFLVRDQQTQEVVAVSNWKVYPPEMSKNVSAPPTSYRALTFSEQLYSWAFWTYDKLVKIVPSWIFNVVQPQKAPYYERKQRWFVKVLKNFNDSLQGQDKRLGYWSLMHLGVSLQYSGRGIASSLLQWGLDKADQEDRAVYIIATTAGSKLYLRRGFEKVSSDIYFEGEPSGGFEVIMMRRPRLSERKL